MFTGSKYINQFNANELIFYGHPIRKSLKDYGQIYKKIREVCSLNKDILSVYTFGEVTTPGISDIDLIFVLKEGAKLPKFLRKTTLDSSSKYILFHPFFIVPEDFMENIAYIYPNSKLNLVYGKKINIKKLSKQDLNLVYRHLINDVILRHYPSDFLNILLSRRINIRMCLLRLNSLHHSFDIFERISGIKKPEWAKISGDIQDMRKKWFDILPEAAKSKLIGLLKTAVYVSLDFVNTYSNFLESKSPKMRRDSILFKGIKNRISFVNEWNPADSLSEMIRHYNKHKNFYSVLPGILSWQLCAYSSAKGALSSYIRKRMNIKCDVKNINNTLMKRIQILNHQVEYAMKLKHSHYPCFFPLGFKNTRGIRNKMIYAYVFITDSSLLRKILNYTRTNLRFIPV